MFEHNLVISLIPGPIPCRRAERRCEYAACEGHAGDARQAGGDEDHRPHELHRKHIHQ